MTEDNISELEKDLKPILACKKLSFEQEHVGKTYGKLFVMRISGRHRKRKTIMALCKCGCGNIKLIAIADAKRLHTKSCGCIPRFSVPKHGEANTSKKNATKEYAAWSAIRMNVFKFKKEWESQPGHYVLYNINHGICDRWMEEDRGYLNFLEDMGRKPEKGRLVKHDKTKRYDKENCYWRTPE